MSGFNHIHRLAFYTFHYFPNLPSYPKQVMGTSKADKEKIKQLLEGSEAVKKEVADLKMTVDQFIDRPDFNQLYAEFKAKNQGIPDIPPSEPDNPPEPDQPPAPTGEVLYDSNRDINWDGIPGDQQVVTGVYGEFKPNGKYFRMKASGNPRMILMKATKELILEHSGDYGRAYVGACNYQSRLEGEFKLTNASHNASFKLRNRHQFADVQSGASDKQRQGGQGTSFAVDKVDADCEIVHGTEISGPSKSLSPKLEINKYYKFKFSQFDKNGKIHIIDELDRGNGFEVVNEGDTSPPAQFFNKAEFEEWSEFWLRGNMKGGGRMYFKNIRLYKL